jgi:hypothetical protein
LCEKFEKNILVCFVPKEKENIVKNREERQTMVLLESTMRKEKEKMGIKENRVE